MDKAGRGARRASATGISRWRRPALGLLVAALSAACAGASAPPAREAATRPPATSAPAAAPTAGPPTAPPTASTQAAAPTTVRMAVLGILSESGIYIADERGYFAEEGLTPDFVTMDSGARALPALAASQVDVSGGSLSPAYLNAAARGLGMKIVAELNSNEPDGSSGYIVLRKDLTDSGAVRDWPDLRGRRAAVSARGSVVDYQLARGLALGGLTIDDVDVVEMSFPDMVPAFGNGSIDVASMTEPLVTIAVERGVATRWKNIGEYLPGEVPALMSFSPDFLANQPDVGRRWVTAYLRGARDYNAAFKRGEGRADVIQILAKHTNVKDPSIYDRMGLSTINPNGTVRLASLQDQQAWWGEQGFLQGSVDIATLVDNRFTEAALEKIGRVEP